MGDRYVKLQNDVILKIGNPNWRHAIIDTISSKKILAYISIKEDLKAVLKAVSELQNNNSLNAILKESLTYYIAISYCKCFTEAKGRGTKLDRKDLDSLDDEYLKLHDLLREIRDNHVAHAGSAEYSKNYLVIEFDENDHAKNRIYSSLLSLSTFNNNHELIRILINKVIEIVDNKSEQKFKKLTVEISKSETKKGLINNSFIPNNLDIKTFKEIRGVLKPLK